MNLTHKFLEVGLRQRVVPVRTLARRRGHPQGVLLRHGFGHVAMGVMGEARLHAKRRYCFFQQMLLLFLLRAAVF